MSQPKVDLSKRLSFYFIDGRDAWIHDGTSWKLLCTSAEPSVVTEITFGRLLRMDLWRLGQFIRMRLSLIGLCMSGVIERIRGRKS